MDGTLGAPVASGDCQPSGCGPGRPRRQTTRNLHISWTSPQADTGALNPAVKTADSKDRLCRFDTLTAGVDLGPVIDSRSLGFICKMGIMT